MNELNEVLKTIPKDGEALSIIRTMSKQGITQLIIKKERDEREKEKFINSHFFKNNVSSFCDYVQKYQTNDSMLFFDSEYNR